LKLVTYRSAASEQFRAGVLVGEQVVDATAAAAHVSPPGSINWGSVKSIVGGASTEQLQQLSQGGQKEAEKQGRRLIDVTLASPIPDPGKILCIGLNYRDHVEEAQRANASLGTTSNPVVFSKFSTALIGDGSAIVLPAAAPEMVDWEGELAVVLRRTASRVSEADAMDYVAGYTIMNDVSARDVQLGSPQWLMGKSFDTSGPCGPALVTVDEVPDPQDLALETRVNGEIVQTTNTALMIHPVRRLISYISSLITLEPGDIIATGTPSGVGFSRDPQVFLKPEDTVTVSISSLGTLSNSVVPEI
jgi:2-keto-4-pentenoate hydratase/2-oxohepta-3-ene-1,7-dioic acid hydratase in catechol pathway